MNNNESKSTEIIDLTQSLVESFYMGNVEPIMEYVDNDIVLIGETNSAFCNGKDELLKKIDVFRKKMINFILKNQRYMCVYSDKYTYVIAGSFVAISNFGSNPGYKKQRATFCWSVKNDVKRIHHLHLSNPVVDEYDDERHVNIKLDTFKNIPENERIKIPRIIVKDKRGVVRFISEDEIIYIKADNMDSIIQCIAEKFEVRMVLKDIAAMLSNAFMRVHKSYVVNRHYIKNILRYNLQMEMDFVVPLSKIKYKDIKNEICL